MLLSPMHSEYGGYSRTVDVSFWHIPAGYRSADLRLLSGVEPPLDTAMAAMRPRAAAPDALLDRLIFDPLQVYPPSLAIRKTCIFYYTLVYSTE